MTKAKTDFLWAQKSSNTKQYSQKCVLGRSQVIISNPRHGFAKSETMFGSENNLFYTK